MMEALMFPKMRLWILMVTLGVILSGTIDFPTALADQSGDVEIPPARPIYSPLQFYNAVSPTITPQSTFPISSPPLITSPSNIVVFQALSTQWDIVLYDISSGSYNALTANDFPDITPRLNREANRIVYSANPGIYYLQIFSMNTDGTDIRQLGSFEQDAFSPYWSPDGSQIVLASTSQDPEGEIYQMTSDGYNITRLTNNSNYDGMPSWSPDGSKIAYISYVDGGYRVWVMNADGSNPLQLSLQPYSAHPAWSPDGTQIAYDADGDGDGWQELWLMNSDGSNQFEFKDYEVNNFDLYAWGWNSGSSSVTYTTVEWIYYYGNWYWVTAYLDCQSVIPGGACIGSIGDVNWNPDWDSADHQAPVTSMAPLPPESPYQFLVNWSGDDFGGTGIIYYDIQVRDGVTGTWTDWLNQITVTSAGFIGLGGHTYYYRARAFDRAGYISQYPSDFQSFSAVEAYKPVSNVHELPEFQRGTLLIHWSGSDFGGSGILNYDIQYRDATMGGNWVNWLTGDTGTSEEFTGIVGHTYYFRSRARDRAQNVEEWPVGDGDTFTSFYEWEMSGTILDGREAPVGNISTNFQAGGVGSLTSDQNGNFTAYGADLSQYDLAWCGNGFTWLPFTRFDGGMDRFFIPFLPPDDNIIQNWGFEAGLTNWQTSGSIPPVTTDKMAHTGAASAFLGNQTEFGLGTEFSDFEYWTNVAGFEADAVGGVHLLWKESDQAPPASDSIYYAQRDSTGNWSSIETIGSQIYMFNYMPSITVEENGTAHVLWVSASDGGLYYSYRLGSGLWSEPFNIAGSIIATLSPLAQFDENGNLLVVWNCLDGGIDEICFSRKPNGGSWEAPQQVTDDSPDSNGWTRMLLQNGLIYLVYGSYAHPIYLIQRDLAGDWSEPELVCPNCENDSLGSVVIDQAGQIHRVWSIYVSSGATQYWAVYYSLRSVEGEWLPVQLISSDGHTPEIVLDANDQPHILWAGSAHTGAFHAYRSADGIWHYSNPITFEWAPYYDIIADRQGSIHVAFGNGYTHWSGGSEWLQPILFGSTNPAAVAYLTVDSNGGVHVAWWEDNVSSSNLMYAGPVRADFSGDASIAQQVTIPMSTTAPTLSFLYQTGGALLSEQATFSVTLSTALSDTLLISDTGWSNGWTHAWADLSPWSGQSVTLTYALSQVGGYANTWMSLDEVTLGSAYPDVWINLDGGVPIAQPGDQFAYTLTYGNYGAVVAESTGITLTLPIGLSFLDASQPPIQVGNLLIWELGDLEMDSDPDPISVTVTVDASAPLGDTLTSTVEIITNTPEINLTNNTDLGQTHIGLYRYIPFVSR
jgi:hypothetical protein